MRLDKSSMISETGKPRLVMHLLSTSLYGGAENAAINIIKKLPQNIRGFYCSPNGKISEIIREEKINYVPIKRLSYFILKRVIKKEQPEIIHAHDFRASILASFFSNRSLVISHIHQNPTWLNGINPKALLYKSRIHKFHKVVTVSEEIRRNKVFEGLPMNKVVTIANYIDADEIKRKSKMYKTPHYDLIFCGRLEAIKGPMDFIDIVKIISNSMPDVRAVMVGGGSLYDLCHKRIEQLRLVENIEMVGFKRNPFPYIANSKCAVITSSSEGFGLVALESLLLKAAVLSYRLPTIESFMPKNKQNVCNTKLEIANRYLELIDSKNIINQSSYYSTEFLPSLLKMNEAWKDAANALYLESAYENQ